jgi:hypothetical protein
VRLVYLGLTGEKHSRAGVRATTMRMERERSAARPYDSSADEGDVKTPLFSPSFVDYGVTVAISGAAAILLPFVDEASRKMPEYSGVLMGGFLAVASLSLAGFWATRQGRS